MVGSVVSGVVCVECVVRLGYAWRGSPGVLRCGKSNSIIRTYYEPQGSTTGQSRRRPGNRPNSTSVGPKSSQQGRHFQSEEIFQPQRGWRKRSEAHLHRPAPHPAAPTSPGGLPFAARASPCQESSGSHNDPPGGAHLFTPVRPLSRTTLTTNPANKNCW